MTYLSLGFYFTEIDTKNSIAECTRILENFGVESAKLKSLENHKLSTQFEIRLKELNKYVPQYTYFGHHPKDADSYGVWIDFAKIGKAQEENKVTITFGKDFKGIKTKYVLDIGFDGMVRFMDRKTQKIIWETV